MSNPHLARAYFLIGEAEQTMDQLNEWMARVNELRAEATKAIEAAGLTAGLPVFKLNEPLSFFSGGSRDGTHTNIPLEKIHEWVAPYLGPYTEPDSTLRTETYVPSMVVKSDAAGYIAAIMVPDGKVADFINSIKEMSYTDAHGALMMLVALTFGAHGATEVATIIRNIRGIAPEHVQESPLFLQVK